jgi:hypothetical protein
MEEAWSSDSLHNVEISKDDDNEYDKYHTSNCRYLNEWECSWIRCKMDTISAQFQAATYRCIS